MKGATILKKISARAKQLKKRHPGAKHSSLMKKAGAEYRAGKLKKKRKPAARKKVHRKKRRVAAVGRVKRTVKRRVKRRVHRAKRTVKRRVRRKAVRHVKVVRRRITRRVKRRAVKRRRVSGKGKGSNLLLFLGLGIGAYLLLRRPATQTIYVPTGNTTKDSAASNIIALASAAGVVGSQLFKIIQLLNNSSASQVQTLNQAVSSGTVNLNDSSAVQSILSNSTPDTTSVAGLIMR